MQLKIAKLEIMDLIPVGLVMTVGGIIIAFGAQVQGEVRVDNMKDACAARTDGNTTYNASAQTCYNGTPGATQLNIDNSYAVNISNKGLEGTYNLSSKLPTVGTVAAIVIVIGLLISGFGYLWTRSGR